MQLHGLPNDILPNIDPITIIILVPLMDRLIYPFLRTRLHLALTATTRITLGFLFAAAAMLYAAALQSRIYSTPPCYSSPSACPEALVPNSNGRYEPNAIHIAWQAPAYILIALSEILASITGLELAYAKAPGSMKSFIMSLFLLTSAGGSVLGVVVAPLARDPWLGWVYGALGVLAAVTGALFWRTFRGLEDKVLKVDDVEEFELVSRSSVDGESDGQPLCKDA